MSNDILGFIGILFKGNRAYIGERGAEAFPKAKIVLAATDAKPGTQKMINDAKNHHHFPLLSIFTKEELGGALGRAEVSYVVITDRKAAEKIIDSLIRKEHTNG